MGYWMLEAGDGVKTQNKYEQQTGGTNMNRSIIPDGFFLSPPQQRKE